MRIIFPGVLSIIMVLGLLGCQKLSKPIGFAKEDPEQKIEYTVEPATHYAK